jgi:8-oxo-dGTP pyrophosphatase MutT (NUDIX family)
MAGDTGAGRAQWLIHGERLVDENPHIRVSLADVELPDGTTFTQYVFRMRRCVVVLVLDDQGSRLLLMRRHRFIIGKWVWELPGGYVDDGEDAAAAAVREAEEETGWRPRDVRFVLSYQPMIGNADFPRDLYLARGADHMREPATDEAAAVCWVPLEEAAAMITSGEIAGAGTIIGVQHALMLRAGDGTAARGGGPGAAVGGGHG